MEKAEQQSTVIVKGAPVEIKFTVEFPERSSQPYVKPPDPFGGTDRREPKDLRCAKCPSCKQALKKIPAAKTKCPYCHQFLYVRTRPEDCARLVVTGADAKRIETDYQIVAGAREPDFRYITTESEVQAERERLTQSFKTKGHAEPSDDDVKWAILNRKVLESATSQGMEDRNIRYTMADFLARRWKLWEALGHYLMVCGFDLAEIGRPSLSPAPLDQISRISRKLKLGREEVREVFQKYRPRGTRLSAFECWTYLELAIWPDPSLLSKPLQARGSVARAPQPHEIQQVISVPGGRKQTIWRDARALIQENNETP
jgi:hypothetical protein